MRVQFLKNHGKFKAGEVTEVSNADAKDYFQRGIAITTTALVPTDYSVKGVSNGRTGKLRSNKSIRR